MLSVERRNPAVKPLGAVLAGLALLLGLAGPASAEAQTVAGSGGDLTELFVSNGSNAVVAKVQGSNIECGASMWVQIVMRDGDGTKYTAMGACYPGDPASGGGWHKSLERGNTLVKCGFTLKYNTTGGFWRFEVPRTCLNKLANRIKVTAEVVATASPGAAGPTKWLSRG
jgi:hypothetical protein